MLFFENKYPRGWADRALAARDVREKGVPLETFYMTGKHGRKIAAYRFGDPTQIRAGKLGGRMAWSKEFKQKVVEEYGEQCGICLTGYEARYLQIDHRVPYEVAGDAPSDKLRIEEFMLVCGSCNRAQSWSCEPCINWKDNHEVAVYESCYWANPENYSHVAMKQIRRLDLTWSEEEVPEYESVNEFVAEEKE